MIYIVLDIAVCEEGCASIVDSSGYTIPVNGLATNKYVAESLSAYSCSCRDGYALC